MFPSESCNSVSKGTFREFRPFSVIAENHWPYNRHDDSSEVWLHFTLYSVKRVELKHLPSCPCLARERISYAPASEEDVQSHVTSHYEVSNFLFRNPFSVDQQLLIVNKGPRAKRLTQPQATFHG